MLGLGVGIDYSLFILSRYRQGLLEGRDPEHAVGRAMATSGSAVLFAGITVCLAMVALGLMGVPYVRTLGLVAALYVDRRRVSRRSRSSRRCSARSARRVNKGKMPWHQRTAETADASRTLSARWAHEIARFPWLFAPLSLIVLLLLASPLLKIETGFPDDGSRTDRHAATPGLRPHRARLRAGRQRPLLIVAELPSSLSSQLATAHARRCRAIQQSLEKVDGVQQVTPITNAPTNTVAVSPRRRRRPARTTTPRPISSSTSAPPRSRRRCEGTGVAADQVYVGGQTAVLIDLTDRINERLFLIIGTVLAGSFLLLMMVFRSLFVPFKAAVMNLLSIGAAYGVLVAVFNWGWVQGCSSVSTRR